MSQKTLFAEVIEELEKAILVAKKMEELGKQPAVEVAILLDKLQQCYEKVLFAHGKVHPIFSEKKEEKHPNVVPEAKQIIVSEEPIMVESTHAPELKQPSKALLIEPTAVTASATIEAATHIFEEPTIDQKAMEEKQKPTKKTEIRGDRLMAGKRFLNDYIAENKKQQDISSKIQAQPIKDLSKVFGISDKFLYTRELFNNDSTQFQNTINTINEMESIDEALIYIGTNYDWQADEPTVIKFIDIIQRRFM